MTQENKNEKWCAVSAFGRTAVYPASKSDGGVFCSTEQLILPEADIKFREAYEYIVKLHNDRLRFKQKQRNKKKNRDGWIDISSTEKSNYVEFFESLTPSEGWNIGGVPVDASKKKTCRRCKQCKDSCEFYDKGICRGIVYPMNPPKYGKCEFDE